MPEVEFVAVGKTWDKFTPLELRHSANHFVFYTVFVSCTKFCLQMKVYTEVPRNQLINFKLFNQLVKK